MDEEKFELSEEISAELIEQIPRTPKDHALDKAGVTRVKYLKVIAEALVAVKKTEYRDAQGNVKNHETPDVIRRQWGAEQAAKIFGDMVTRVESRVEVNLIGKEEEELLRCFE